MQIYDSFYSNSWAICIGINSYQNVQPLKFAVNDATEFANMLIQYFSFSTENVKLIINEQATKKEIMKCYLDLSEKCDVNDKVIFFYAGHGETRLANYGEVGFLVPYDASKEDISTLIRWDDLTKNSDLIPAKHMLFILDACFSGLIFTRSFASGTRRFIKDMLQRYSRQAIAAGKANQTVSDGNGPIPDHSIFTGHLLNGLKGEASISKNILTANSLMQYVYLKVANDNDSHQTPHYGYFAGEGDFLLKYPIENKSETKEEDILFEISNFIETNTIKEETFLSRIKTFLSEEKYKIKLDDLITNELKNVLFQLNANNFPSSNGEITEEYLLEVIQKIEQILLNLQAASIAIGYWGNEDQKELLRKLFPHLCSHIINQKPPFNWNLRWYPIIWLLYSAGISLLIKDDYKMFYKLISIQTKPYDLNQPDNSLLISYSIAYRRIVQSEIMRVLKGYEKFFTPLSEFLFKRLQSKLEDILFIGDEYEFYFDQYEILVGIETANRFSKSHGHFYGPIGRFGWKYSENTGSKNPLIKFFEIGKEQGKEWLPLKGGFFDSNSDGISDLSEKSFKMISNLQWY